MLTLDNISAGLQEKNINFMSASFIHFSALTSCRRQLTYNNRRQKNEENNGDNKFVWRRSFV